MANKDKSHSQSEMMAGNLFAQKHTPEQIMVILQDIVEGLIAFKCKDTEQYIPTGEGNTDKVKKRVMTGYSCLQRGLAHHNLYDDKLKDWDKTHREKNPDVSLAIAHTRGIARQMIYIHTVEGFYPSRIGEFLFSSVLGYKKDGEKDPSADGKTISINWVAPEEEDGDDAINLK